MLPFDLRVNVEVACYFRYTVSMDVLIFDHHASNNTYVCWIPSPRRAVSRKLWDTLLVERPRS